MRKSDPKVILLQDIKNRDSILASRFRTNIITVVFCKPITQLIQTFCKRRKASLFILCTIVWVSNTDASIDPSFMDNFKKQ